VIFGLFFSFVGKLIFSIIKSRTLKKNLTKWRI
jgi:hypothetical protein